MDATLYDPDVQAWAQQQAVALRAGQRAAVGIPHIATVIDALDLESGAIVRRDLAQLLFDALTWRYDTYWRHPSWGLRQQVAQHAIARHLHTCPRLRAWLPVLLHGAYLEARQHAAQQTTRPLSTLRICRTSSPPPQSTWWGWRRGWRERLRPTHDDQPLRHSRHTRLRECSMGIRHQYLS